MAEQEEQLVNLTIDGRPVSVPKGTLIWAAAQKLDIEIPIYCYHPKMDPLGACRMCFVQVEKMPKPMTACTTEVTEGMVVSTTSPMVKKARAGTLEFLLINHPLDCPICDKGGECDLQDFTLRYGPNASRFDLSKRHYQKPIPVSEAILLDRERCISCQRCVRFCQDVAMEDGLVMLERGFRTEVGVQPEAPFDSIFSGNVVEMCPVGALTAKSYRFVTRPWELKRAATICGLCSVGCNVSADVRVDKLLRQYSRTNDEVEEGFLCDRGRWSLDLANSPDRLRTPLIRRNGKLEPASWEEAIALVASRLREIARRDGPEAVGGIASTRTTNEETYLFQKLLRAGLGTNNVDHSHGRFPGAEGGLPWAWTDSIAGLERAATIVLLGTDTYLRQPIIDLRIRRAIRKGARVWVVTPEPARLDRLAAGVIRYAPGQTGAIARALLQTVLSEGLTRGAYAGERAASLPARLAALAQSAPDAVAAAAQTDAEALRTLAREIAAAPGAVILYDEQATLEPSGATLAQDALDLALLTDNFGRSGAGVGPLMADVNGMGARDMGALPDTLPGYRPVSDAQAREALVGAWGAPVPDAPGFDYAAMSAGGVRGLYVMGADPAKRLTPAGQETLARMEFLVVQDVFLTETARLASVVLPAVAYTEKDGTFTSVERRVQVVRKAMLELPGARADWRILTDIAAALGLSWSYRGAADILAEIARCVPLYAGASRRGLGMQGARWPLAPGVSSASVRGADFLTWDMLAQGVGRGSIDATLAASAGGEERA